MTEEDVLPGTPAFIAPEVLLGVAADARSDVYQLGLTLYTMLTGTLPYHGTVRSVLRQINDGPPVDPNRLADSNRTARIPRDLETICLKAIERQPERRYQSASELRDDLHRYEAGESILARRPSLAARLRRWTRKRPRTAAILTAAVTLLVIISAANERYQQQRQQLLQQAELHQRQQDRDRRALADQTQRAQLAELRSEQLLSQSLSTVLAARQVCEPQWVDPEQQLLSALLAGLEQAFDQMRLASDRNPALGESALAIAKLRVRVHRTAEAVDAIRFDCRGARTKF